jgi:hypothetical protein
MAGYGIKACCRETKGNSILKRFFACAPSVLDYWWRRADFALNRSYDGLTSKLFRLEGHPLIAFLLPLTLLLFLVLGPTLGWRGPLALAVLAASWACLYIAARVAAGRFFLEGQFLIISADAVAVWFLADPNAVEAGGTIYRSTLIPLVPVLMLAPLIVSKVLALRLIRPLNSSTAFRGLLPFVRLHPKPPDAPIFSLWDIGLSLLHAPLKYPMHLLMLPAVVILFIPYHFSLGWYTAGLGIVSWLLISFVSLHQGFNSILPVLTRIFFYGGSLVVSLAVMVLSVGRVLEISYIKTVVEFSPWGTLLSILVCAYVFFWFIEYWINRLLGEELIALIRGPQDPPGRASYDLDPLVAPKGREVQLHGGARFMAVAKWLEHSEVVFQSYERKELFQRLAEKGAISADPQIKALSAEAKKVLDEISRRTRSYFSSINLLLIVIAVVGAVLLNSLPQQPLAKATTPAPSTGVDLVRLLWQDKPRERVILLAASGGGTRAALYTQSVLRGLHADAALDDIVLASGVSGGGAALAYFAAFRDELSKDSAGTAWDRFACAMSYPFIQDVLEGAPEWRITAGTRLGQLLAESFERVFYRQGPDSRRSGITALGHVSDLGLILNTSLAGRVECPECADSPDFAAALNKHRESTDGSVAGGVLVVTNLRDSRFFPQTRSSLNIQYVTIADPDIALTTAAALTANFPPVFSNAAVDADHCCRYWVTDGGAVENRGLLSLLLVLRAALASFPADAVHRPDIHIVMADASGKSTKYVQDRAIGTLLGAPEKMANQLIGELLEEVKASYAKHGGRILYHELGMPDFWRSDGGLGTHWMLPRRVTMKSPPGGRKPAEEQMIEMDAFAVRALINTLHLPEPDRLDMTPCFHEDTVLSDKSEHGRHHIPEIRQWIELTPHPWAWKCLRESLSGKK